VAVGGAAPASPEKEIMTYVTNPPVADWHRQIIIGTVLGGSSLVKPAKGRNCYLFMRSRRKNWIEFKANELQPFSNGKISQDKNSFRWHSNCYPVFAEMRELLYADGRKRVTMDLLNTLRPVAFGVWYGDCGRVVRKRAYLNTHKLGEESTRTISDFFNSMEYENEVVRERGYLRVAFTPQSTLRYFRVFVEVTPGCGRHKLIV
jgi:hypothetical protein